MMNVRMISLAVSLSTAVGFCARAEADDHPGAPPDGDEPPETKVGDLNTTLQSKADAAWQYQKKLITDYYSSGRSTGAEATGMALVAGEAMQTAGQLIVDRASQAAYAQLSTKLIDWLQCTRTGPKGERVTFFPETCQVIQSLRLQDLAMASEKLRASITADALAWLGWTPPAPLAASRERKATALVAARRAVSLARVDTTDGALVTGPLDFLRDGLERRIVPLLNWPIEAITGHSAEVELRSIVDRALHELQGDSGKKFCMLKSQDRVFAGAALAFAACASQSTDTCSIMLFVEQLDDGCPVCDGCAPHYTRPQLSYAQSIAGHLLEAYALTKGGQPDGQARLRAASEATFEIACMYAVKQDGGDAAKEADKEGYVCKVFSDQELKDKKVDRWPLATTEQVALGRDLVRAAIEQDAAELAAIVIRAAQRILPDVTKRDEPKALRTLATIASYAATYASDETADDAHRQRTALLESLTRDMTVRTDRGGDWIISVGGALRGVGGARIGRSVNGERPTALTSPLSLTLGFGVDRLSATRRDGLHLEASVFDLGQYLAWDEGAKVQTPDLEAVLSPALTAAYFWGREIPFYLGATVGYSPRYEFTAGDKPRGSFNIGLTLGAYVPLFDFN